MLQPLSRLPKWMFLASAVVALIFIGGILAFLIEPSTFKTIGDGWWWALVTITTLLIKASPQSSQVQDRHNQMLIY